MGEGGQIEDGHAADAVEVARATVKRYLEPGRVMCPTVFNNNDGLAVKLFSKVVTDDAVRQRGWPLEKVPKALFRICKKMRLLRGQMDSNVAFDMNFDLSRLKVVNSVLPFTPHDPLSCARCGRDGNLRACSRCCRIWYCGHDCQKAHWREHRTGCRDEDRSGEHKLVMTFDVEGMQKLMDGQFVP